MATIKITTNIKQIQAAFSKAPGLTQRRMQGAINLSGTEIKRLMKDEVPKKTKTLMRSIQSIPGNLRVSIGPNLKDAPHAIFVHFGTKAHLIKPRNKQALFWKGAQHPVKVVHHPGTKPNPFVDRTALKAKPIVQKIFTLSLRQLIKDISVK